MKNRGDLFVMHAARAARLAAVGLMLILGIVLLHGCGGGGAGTSGSPATGAMGTSLSVSIEKSAAQPGQTVNVTATLTTSTGQPIAGKTVTFAVGGAVEGSGVTNPQGVVTLPCILSPNLATHTYVVAASFPGDSGYTPCQSITGVAVAPPVPPGQPIIPPTAPPAATATALALNTTNAQAGQAVNLTATLSSGGAPLASDNVTFILNDALIGSSVTNTSGQAMLTYNVLSSTPAGSNTFIAAFAGSGPYTPSSASAGLTVTSVKILTALSLQTPSVVTANLQSTINVTARLTDVSGNPLPNETLSAAAGGGLFGYWQSTGTATTDANGNANLVIQTSFSGASPGIVNGPVILLPPFGAIQVPVTFAGDSTHAATLALLNVNIP